jgi:hypothetical protein
MENKVLKKEKIKSIEKAVDLLEPLSDNKNERRGEIMNRKIMIEFPDIKSKFSATLLDEEEPELCEKFWQVLETPLKMICHHTLSTGDLFEGYGRPPIHPVEVGSQANPIGRKQWLLSKLDPGMLMVLEFSERHSV